MPDPVTLYVLRERQTGGHYYAYHEATSAEVLAHPAVLALTADRDRLRDVLDAARDVLTAIRDYPGAENGDEDGYPIEVVCDQYAYRRIVDSYRRAARQGLEATEAADRAPDAGGEVKP